MGFFSKLADWLVGCRELEWTVVTPKKPGWYWAEYEWGSVRIVLVGDVEGRMCVLDDELTDVLTYTEVVRWAGPVRLPASRSAKRKKA